MGNPYWLAMSGKVDPRIKQSFNGLTIHPKEPLEDQILTESEFRLLPGKDDPIHKRD